MTDDKWLKVILEDMKEDIRDVSKEVKAFNGSTQKIAKSLIQQHENGCVGLAKIPDISEKVNTINDYINEQKEKEHYWRMRMPKPTRRNLAKLGGAGAVISLITALVNYFKGGG